MQEIDTVDEERHPNEDNNKRRQSDDVGLCLEESPSCDLPSNEIEKENAKVFSTKKWYHRLLLRRDRLHRRKVESHTPKGEEEVQNSNGVETDCTDEIIPGSSNDTLVQTGSGVELESDHTTSKLCRKDNRNFRTMEALGMYGLLTPAVAAVPASDEVNFAF